MSLIDRLAWFTGYYVEPFLYRINYCPRPAGKLKLLPCVTSFSKKMTSLQATNELNVYFEAMKFKGKSKQYILRNFVRSSQWKMVSVWGPRKSLSAQNETKIARCDRVNKDGGKANLKFSVLDNELFGEGSLKEAELDMAFTVMVEEY